MEHHDLDPYPEPREKAPLYVNERKASIGSFQTWLNLN